MWLQFLVTAVTSGLAFLVSGQRLAASVAVGGALMWANVAVLGWTWWRVLAKKPVAWTIVVIVIKYAVLLGSIVLLTQTPDLNMLGVGLGITSFIFAALATAFITKKEKHQIG
ncbi:MAG: ATP synthase subunit I [Bdellovibrionales bacterium]